MPIMDGFEATKRIRLFENDTGISKVTIIALTANAMQGDRDNCLAAGMDDYLAKPYNLIGLYEKLSGWLSPSSSPPEKIIETKPAPKMAGDFELGLQADIVDLDKFNETKEMMGEKFTLIIDAFIASGSKHVLEIQDAFRAGDYLRLRDAAHTLKGSSSVLGLQRLFEVCDKVEKKCILKEFENLEPHIISIAKLFGQSETEVQLLIEKENR